MLLRCDVQLDTAKLKALPAKIDAAVQVGLVYSAAAMRDALDERIANSPRGGRIYPSRRGDGTMHEASRPGVAFAEDTGETQSEIKIRLQNLSQNEIEIGWEGERAEQVERLEFGSDGGKLAPRPTVIPTALDMIPEVEKIMQTWLEDLLP